MKKQHQKCVFRRAVLSVAMNPNCASKKVPDNHNYFAFIWTRFSLDILGVLPGSGSSGESRVGDMLR